jgi:hypothetical protein
MTTSQMDNSNSKQLCGQTARRTTLARHAFQLSICLALLAAASNTKLLAQYNGSFVDVQPVPGLEHSSAWEYISDISDDGLTIGMTSTRSGGRSPSVIASPYRNLILPTGPNPLLEFQMTNWQLSTQTQRISSPTETS